MNEISSSKPGRTDRLSPSCTGDTSMQFMPSPFADRVLEKLPRKQPRQRSRKRCDRSTRSSGGPPAFDRGCIGSRPTKSPTCTGVRRQPRHREVNSLCVPSAPASRPSLPTKLIPGSWAGRCTKPSTNFPPVTEKPSPCAISAGCQPTRRPLPWVARSRLSPSSCIVPLEAFERSWPSTRRLSQGVSNEATSRRHHRVDPSAG